MPALKEHSAATTLSFVFARTADDQARIYLSPIGPTGPTIYEPKLTFDSPIRSGPLSDPAVRTPYEIAREVLFIAVPVAQTFLIAASHEHPASWLRYVGLWSDFLHTTRTAYAVDAYALIAAQKTTGTWPTDPIPASFKELVLSAADPFYGYDKFAEANWDGLGAEAITSATLDYARRLLDITPSTFRVPHIAPGADGSIGFYWTIDEGALQSLCLDVGPAEKWRAYWQLRDGSFGNVPSQQIDDKTSTTLATLFARINT